MHNLNVQLLEFINGAAGYYRPLDLFFIIATSYITLIVLGTFVVGYFLFYLPWRVEGMARVQALKNAWNIIWTTTLAVIIANVIKVITAFPRPFQTLKHLHVLISLPDSYSFPSGHATFTMALATSIYFYNKRFGEVLFAFAFAVGMARIYVGVHYPLDVGVGFLIGYIVPKFLHIKREVVK
jgi:undecaprenyl-diphosphatase